MAWSAPRTWVVGELVTAAMMNTFIRDNQVYLKINNDLVPSIVQSTPVNAEDVIYRNTTCYMRMVLISAALDIGEAYRIFVENATPPTIRVASLGEISAQSMDATVTFMVPYNWYYNCATQAGDPTITEWAEWDLH